MGRLAGDNKHYTLGVIDHKGKAHKEYTYDFTSITTVTGIIEKPSLPGWYYSETLKGMESLLKHYGSNLVKHNTKDLKALLNSHKLGPYHVRNQAATKGTDIHKELELLCKGEDIQTTPETEGLVHFFEDKGLKPEDIIGSEMFLVSFRYRVAGTVDLIYKDPTSHEIVICDLKTGKGVYPSHFVQGQGYRICAEETAGIKADKVTVLHVRPPHELERGYEELEFPEITRKSFKAALDVYRALPHDYWEPKEV